MAEKLTKEQSAAIYDRGGRLLVSAAAGSGKTKVLVDRLMCYIMGTDESGNQVEKPANIDDFLIITYTKAAASELRVKIGTKLSEVIASNPEDKHLQEQLQRLYMTKISTVHSFCSEIIRRYAYRLDIPADFRQAEDNECTQMQSLVLDKVLNQAYDSILENDEFRQFVDSQGFGRNDKQLNKVILQIYHQSVNFPDPDKWLDKCAAFMDVDGLTDVSQTKWGEYLMKELATGLDQAVAVMDRAFSIVSQCMQGTQLEIDMNECISQLHRLRNCTSWDEIIDKRNVVFPNLRSMTKKGSTPQQRKAIVFLQNTAKSILKEKLESIVDRSDVILEELRRCAPAVRGMCSVVKSFARAYDAEKRRRHLMDYTDLEQFCLTLFCGKNRDTITPIAREVGADYREIMVDEYQDSNAVQDMIFDALTNELKNCFMVGDVKQSIYQFRQADPSIFLKKYDTYADAHSAKPGEGRRVLLSHNFRSGDDILAAANAVFETCMRPELGGVYYDESVKLKKVEPLPPLDETAVEFYAVETSNGLKDEQEAAFVAQRISELLDGTHYVRDKERGMRVITPEDITILIRSPSSQEETFTQALAKKGIRYVSSRDVPLLETQENMLMIALLQVINNPQLDIPLATVLCSCVFGFTADDLAQIRSENPYCSLYDSLCRSRSPKAKAFVETISTLRAKARMAGICQIIEEIYACTQMTAVFSSMADGAQRLENMEALYQHAAEFESWGRKDLARFVEHIEIMDASKLKASQSKQSAGCVSITSIHKSKGLEYPVVFLCGLNRAFSIESLKAKVFTHKELGFGICATDNKRRILYPTISKKAIKQQMIKERNAEEMRVLYVAMTRARDRLIMTYAGSKVSDAVMQCVIAQNENVQDIHAQYSNGMGNWVLLSAVKRLEAGELFQISDHCDKAQIQEYPWLIRVVSPPALEDHVVKNECAGVSDALLRKIRNMQGFTYAHTNATEIPSKQTATQLNRIQSERSERFWRKPGQRKTGGSVYGNIVHGLMEHMDYGTNMDQAAIEAQLDALVSRGLLTREEKQSVDVGQLVTFFASDLGRMLKSHPNVLREFQFSILDELQDPALAGEKVLLQGVVDCAMLDDDGIVILDFKTDRVTESDLPEKVAHYQPQLRTYAKALSRIYGKPLKAAYLYFFRLGKAVPVL